MMYRFVGTYHVMDASHARHFTFKIIQMLNKSSAIHVGLQTLSMCTVFFLLFCFIRISIIFLKDDNNNINYMSVRRKIISIDISVGSINISRFVQISTGAYTVNTKRFLCRYSMFI